MERIKPKHKFYNNVLKRIFDIVFSMIAMVLFCWLYVIIAILVKANLGSPVIFVHERPGKIDPHTGKEKLFKLYKFRSMTNEVDENGVLLPSAQRMTKFGRILRATSLDEIPEIWNIFKGDMSFVGPRPWNKKALAYYTSEEHKRHLVRPGLTGLAQVNGRNVATWDERFKYDLYYVQNLSFVLDLKILFKTVVNVFIHKDIIEAGKQELFWEYRKKQWQKGIIPRPEKNEITPETDEREKSVWQK